MKTPERHPQEGQEEGSAKGKISITFPDGTSGEFDSREEAIEAMQAWREAA